MGVSRNMTAVDTTGSLFGPEFVFSADYFTDSDIETRGLFGFVSSSATGSNIFTIATRISRSVADQDVNFGDAKFNVLGLETDTSGLTNARQNEYTFLQAKHSQFNQTTNTTRRRYCIKRKYYGIRNIISYSF